MNDVEVFGRDGSAVKPKEGYPVRAPQATAKRSTRAGCRRRLFGGAATFFLADQLIDRLGDGQANADNAAGQSALVVPLVLGATLDGIPESVVIGLGLVGGGTVSLAMLVAVFMSNLPEAAAGTVGMRSSGWSRTKIFLLWYRQAWRERQ